LGQKRIKSRQLLQFWTWLIGLCTEKFDHVSYEFALTEQVL